MHCNKYHVRQTRLEDLDLDFLPCRQTCREDVDADVAAGVEIEALVHPQLRLLCRVAGAAVAALVHPQVRLLYRDAGATMAVLLHPAEEEATAPRLRKDR